ncbi:uncharacterized protein V2V93DRAFT_265723 [Kockiozyma suomiensis]|uniref:uncharacterized protein n=1 Tax=Kockiozyma suomiensis TaxID=1337062 RepID=UPI0033440551
MRILKTRPVHAALLVLAIIPLVVAFGSSDSLNRKILPSQIQTLTLRKDAKTTGRRLKPAPQLKTVGGDAKGLYEVEAMQCRNMGSGDGGPEDVQWSCVADLPGYFKLGRTDVICEGYKNADDPYVLKGSCGVEYTLHLTDIGRQRYGKKAFGKTPSTNDYYDGSSSLSTLFWFVIGCVLLYMVCSYLAAPTTSASSRGFRRRSSGLFGNFFGGDDNNDDPPPPYSGGGGGSGGGKAFSYTQQQQQRQWQQAQQGNWRPGFWSGLGAGALGAGLYNRLSGQNQAAQRANWIRENSIYDNYEPPRRGGFTRFNGGNSEDSSPTQSTGFGGTRRR